MTQRTLRALVVDDNIYLELSNRPRSLVHMLLRQTTGLRFSASYHPGATDTEEGRSREEPYWRVKCEIPDQWRRDGVVLSAALVPWDFPRRCLRPGHSARPNADLLRWAYADDGRPLGVSLQVSRGGSVDLSTRTAAGHQPGLCIRVAFPKDDKPEDCPFAGIRAPVNLDLFLLSYWPLDRQHDIVGAWDGHARFWNLILLDNLLLEGKLVNEGWVLTRDDLRPAAVFNADREFWVFEHLHVPDDSDMGWPPWLPDRRTQTIIEVSREGGWEQYDAASDRRVWPGFRGDKNSLTCREYTATDGRPEPGAPFEEGVFARRIRAPLQKLASRVAGLQDPAFANLADRDGWVSLVASTDYPLFLAGPAGVGKSRLARAIHAMSGRSEGPFVEVNCASIPKEGNFFESTVFGRAPGAVGPGDPGQQGFFEAADGGTLFLDEIHHFKQSLQAQLLTVVQEGRYFRLGSTQPEQANVRLVCASNDPKTTSQPYSGDTGAEHSLRPDLFQRLTFHLHEVPPLSDSSFEEFEALFEGVFAEVQAGLAGRALADGDAIAPALAALDPSAISLVGRLHPEEQLARELHERIHVPKKGEEGDWSEVFTVGGNIRLLRQLTAKAILLALGSGCVGFRHFVRARAKTVQMLASSATETPGADCAGDQVSRIRRLNDAWSDTGADFDVDSVDRDVDVVRRLLSLWEGPDVSWNQETVLFRDWVEYPNGLATGLDIGPKEEQREKWRVVVVFAFCWHLCSVQSWSTRQAGLRPEVKRVCSDRAFSDRTRGFRWQLEEAWKSLGYKARGFKLDTVKKTMQSDFGLPEPDSPWRPTASNDEAVLKAMSSAHHEYVTELLRRIRDLP